MAACKARAGRLFLRHTARNRHKKRIVNIDHVNVMVLTKLCEYLLDGEPMFIIRARDVACVATVSDYVGETKRRGGNNASRSLAKLDDIIKWQAGHMNKLRPAD